MYPAPEKYLYTLTCIRRWRSVYMKCLYTFTCIWRRRSIYVHLHVSGVGEVFIYMCPAPEKCLYEVFILLRVQPSPCYFTQSALPIYQTGCCSVCYTCDLSRLTDFPRCRLFAQLGHTFVLSSGDR